MRSDMQEVMTERPRHGGRQRPNRDDRAFGAHERDYVRDIDTPLVLNDADFVDSYDTGPKAMPMRGRRSYDRKERDYLTGPLKKFLQARVGFKWDDIYSEACQVAHGHNGVMMLDILEGHVERDVYKDERGVIRDGQTGREIDKYYRDAYYVDPEDGRLKCVSQRNSWVRPVITSKLVRFDGRAYFRDGLIWYRVRVDNLAPTDRPLRPYWRHHVGNWVYTTHRDVFEKGSQIPTVDDRSHARQVRYRTSVEDLVNAYGEPVVCVWKQQAGKKECRKLNALTSPEA
jgi:hypothetical protein